MSNDFIKQLMMDAEREIYGGMEKSANDANGKPEQSEEQGGGNDIMAMAQAWMLPMVTSSFFNWPCSTSQRPIGR